ncbi:uncharacterized protein F5891DRAFT_1187795 [Suillus fuscotomentosus]|uniref:Uncharacterized protein n=1 Tax=Suillus fuscotomentosus TaxID=1912939 RepID=A0AAD4E863_9AGAM|nr:uncharacterized protein F5891DRAFT_1187795 [Suillus fuscotomentosus]KAG1901096.1 hypothetical protein F5891DRAFT_1187795 [Suillus fuscotomentosus]
MTQDGLTTSSIWKREFIHDMADPLLITPYFILCHPLLEEWHCEISLASTQSIAMSHDKICDILTWGISMISQQLAQIPPPALPAPPSAPEPTIAPLPPPASTSQQVATVPASQTVPPVPPSVPASVPTVAQSLPDLSLAAGTNLLPHPVEDNGSQSNTQHRQLFLCVAGPYDRFGFKSSSADKQDPREETQPIGCSSKKAVGKSLECEAKKDRMWDLDERDESENDADEQDHNDQPSEDEDSLLRVVLPWSGSKPWFEPDQWSGFSNAHGRDWLFVLSSNKKSNPHQDARDIVFYNDPDDTIPLCAQSSSKSAPTDAFSVLLRAGCKPAPLTVGAQCSICTSKPSAHLRDADNACSHQASSPSTSHKCARALSSTTTEPLVTKKVVLQLTAPLSDNDDSHVPGADTDCDTNTNDAPAKDQPEDEEEPEDAITRNMLSKKWVCKPCKDASEPESKYTFWDGISTLRTHICCQKNHFQLYKTHCEAAGITMHPRAVPTGEAQCLSRQSTLNSNLIPKPPMFSKAGLLKYIMELIVTEDEALQLIDKPVFRRLLSYVRPALVEGDIPHCTKLTKSVKAHALTVVDAIRERLAKVDSQVSMTFNSWTSIIGDPFFSITSHYI